MRAVRAITRVATTSTCRAATALPVVPYCRAPTPIVSASRVVPSLSSTSCRALATPTAADDRKYWILTYDYCDDYLERRSAFR
jgi:hypothetical protein